MAKFNFRLQQYLGIKEQLEEQKELEYAKALRLVEEEKYRLNFMIQNLKNTVLTLREAVKASIDTYIILQHNNSIERMKHHIAAQRERLKAAEEFAEIKRLELVEAMKERKALETVKENARETFLKEVDIAERKITDELVSFKYTVKNQ